MPRSKREKVRKEFPFLDNIISPEQMEMILERKPCGFVVEKVGYDFLFDYTGTDGSIETWIAYNSSSVPTGHAERLPQVKWLWEVFPYMHHIQGGGKRREFVAVVRVVKRRGKASRIIVSKMPKNKLGNESLEWRAFERCLEGIRRVAGWPDWKIHNLEHRDNIVS